MRLARDVLNEIDPTPLNPADAITISRRLLGITQEDLCKITGLKQSNLSAIENGKIEMTVHYAQILAAGLGKSPISILFPNGSHFKTEEMKEIEKKFESFMKKNKNKRLQK